MRTYIFTPRERDLIQRMLAGERNDAVWNLMYRLKTFKILESDIALYMKASKAVLAEK